MGTCREIRQSLPSPRARSPKPGWAWRRDGTKPDRGTSLGRASLREEKGCTTNGDPRSKRPALEMISPTDIPKLAAAFASEADRFVSWLDHATVDEKPVLNMRELHELLGLLQAAASRIPAVAPDAETPQGVEVRLNPPAAAKIREKLPINAYSVVFDPLEFDPLEQSSPRPVMATIDNDLGDNYADLMEGLALYRAGQYQDAVWQWHFSYYSHWGRHLSHAQSAIWQYLSAGNWA
jgi:hypothetical protein